MKSPEFWWRRSRMVPGGSLAGLLLAPFGALYCAIAARRMATPGKKVAVPVICVGNFTAGGAGKTPLALALGRLALDKGRRPFFLTRGYGGRLNGALVVDAERHRAEEVGDEALLLARVAPTVKCADRVAGADFAIRQGADLIIMDDGFQNPALGKDVSLIAVDAGRGIGNGQCLPAGPLRAPLETQIGQASALVVIGESAGREGAGRAVNAAAQRNRPILHGRLRAEGAPELEGRRVVAFAGIGRPEKFFATLRELGAIVVEAYGFPDHHRFDASDARALLSVAERGLTPVTTEKDFVRLNGAGRPGRELAAMTLVVPVRFAFEDPRRAEALIDAAIAAANLRDQ